MSLLWARSFLSQTDMPIPSQLNQHCLEIIHTSHCSDGPLQDEIHHALPITTKTDTYTRSLFQGPTPTYISNATAVAPASPAIFTAPSVSAAAATSADSSDPSGPVGPLEGCQTGLQTSATRHGGSRACHTAGDRACFRPAAFTGGRHGR